MIINLNNQQNPIVSLRELLSKVHATLYYTRHELKHPLGIYNTAHSTTLKNFSKTTKTLLRVIYERPFLAKTSKEGDRSLMGTLLTAQKELLYGLMEYMDDCDNILLCFFPSKDARKKDPQAKNYRKSTQEYRSHIGKVVNYLKHNQGRLLDITFYNERLALPGYFIVGATNEDTVGPVRLIHSGNNAFSFARDLRYHLFHFYAVALHLQTTLSKIQGKDITSFALEKEVLLDEESINIASCISNLPSTFYPDELIKPIPNVMISHGLHASDQDITLIYPDEAMEVNSVPHGMRIVTSHMGDGVTRSFELPYMNNK
jgi:hypothetical protein